MTIFPTDEDRQIQRLQIHRDLIGWLLQELQQANIEAVRTTGNDSQGDLMIIKAEDVPKAQTVLKTIKVRLEQS